MTGCTASILFLPFCMLWGSRHADCTCILTAGWMRSSGFFEIRNRADPKSYPKKSNENI
jgi:hypothetical protein